MRFLGYILLAFD